MDATERARRSDALFYDGITSRRILCDMIARLEDELQQERGKRAYWYALVQDIERDMRAAIDKQNGK
jgi:hypothetical protein